MTRNYLDILADTIRNNWDQPAFKAQKDQPGGKKTMKAYYWKVCGDAYDEAHQG